MALNPKIPSVELRFREVLKNLRGIPRIGIIKEKDGMVYADISEDFITKALEVLYDYERPNSPVGAHIVVFSKRESEDLDHMPELGKKVKFELVRGRATQPNLEYARQKGLSEVVSRYQIEIQSPDLQRIRKNLYGLETDPGFILKGFFIDVGIKYLDPIFGSIY